MNIESKYGINLQLLGNGLFPITSIQQVMYYPLPSNIYISKKIMVFSTSFSYNII